MALIKDYRIVIGSNPAVNERRAAAVVARYIRLMTGAAAGIGTATTARDFLHSMSATSVPAICCGSWA